MRGGISWLMVSCFCLLAAAGTDTNAQTLTTQPATHPEFGSPTIATPKSEPAARQRFLRLHEQFVARARQGNIDLLFLGASIVENWKDAPEVWAEYYGPLNAANFGIGGDRVQHVLWRIENGELEGIAPRVIVLNIGSNNSNSDPPDAIIAGIRKLLGTIARKSPDSRVLLLAILPRNKPTDLGQMATIERVNAGLAELDDGTRVRFLDMGPKFVGPDGRANPELFKDGLHPNARGYQVWAQTMRPLLDEMMRR